MANKIENLVPLNERTKTEQRRIATAGGKASGKARRQKKAWSEILERIGNLPVKSQKNRAIMREAGLTDDEMISDVQKMFQLNMKADAGDLKAIETIAKIRGELKNININENYNTEVVPDVIDISGGADDKADNGKQED